MRSKILLIACVLQGFLLASAIKTNDNQCRMNLTVDITDGLLIGDAITKDNVTYTKKNYFKSGDGRFLGCLCNVKKCVKKCCDFGFSMGNETKTCLPSARNFTLPQIYHLDREAPTEEPFSILPNMMCEGRDKFMVSAEEFTLQTNANLYAFSEEFVPPEDFCLDEFDYGESFALICLWDEEQAYIYSIGMLISIPFLFATLVIYALLPECNLHGKALMCYVFSLMMAYILLVTIQLQPDGTANIQCILLALTCYFFFAVSFFWMNVMCIDIWWAFSGYRNVYGGRNAERKRFLLYSIYAWGIPIIFTIIVSVINQALKEQALRDNKSPPWYYPGIGTAQCWFQGGLTSLVYFYGPLGVLICINVCLFVLTALKIWKAKQETAVLRKDDNKRHNYDNDKQRFNLYLKLLIAMGINWSAEIISWTVEWRIASSPVEIWYLTDFCNALYGVFIFFVFVFKKNIWRMLQKRYYSFIGKPHLAHSMTTRVTSASLHDKSVVESNNI